MDQQSLTFQVFSNPPVIDPNAFNSAAMHEAEWPAANGITTAKSLSKLYCELACDRLLSTKTLDAAETPQVEGPDRVLVLDTRFGLGFALPSDLVNYAPTGEGFGHDGAGGSLGFGDRRNKVGFGYVPNQMSASLGADERVQNLTRALYASLGEG
jgi:CubicO group peptidase (beta-lactamase class C family)